jgi:hypothetical protein
MILAEKLSAKISTLLKVTIHWAVEQLTLCSCMNTLIYRSMTF